MRTEIFSHSRHPFEIFILALCEISTIPTILGVTPPPGTIAALVPQIVALVWSWIVFIGAGGALFSVLLRDRGTGLIIEQCGLAFTALACIFYGVIIGYYTYDRGGLTSAGITVGFGIACLVRCWQIQKYLHRVNKVTLKAKKGKRINNDDLHDLGHEV